MANVTFTRSTDATVTPATTQGLITFNTGKKAIYLSDGSTYHQCGAGSTDALLNRGWIRIASTYQTYSTFITSTNTACVNARTHATDWLVRISSVPYNTLYPATGIAGTDTSTVSIPEFVVSRTSATSGYEFSGRPCYAHNEPKNYAVIATQMVIGSSTKNAYVQYIGFRVTNGSFYGVTAQCNEDISSYIQILAYRY